MNKTYAIFRILRSEHYHPAPGLVHITMIQVRGIEIRAPSAHEALVKAKRLMPTVKLQLCVVEV